MAGSPFAWVQHHKVSVVVHRPKDLSKLSNLAHLIGPKVSMLRKQRKELSNFRLYQKEQIPWFGSALSVVGSF